MTQADGAQRRLLLARIYLLQENYAAARAALLQARIFEPNNQQVIDLLQQIAGR